MPFLVPPGPAADPRLSAQFGVPGGAFSLLLPPRVGNSPLCSSGLACCTEFCGWKERPVTAGVPGWCCFVRECQPPDRTLGLLLRSQSRGCCSCGTWFEHVHLGSQSTRHACKFPCGITCVMTGVERWTECQPGEALCRLYQQPVSSLLSAPGQSCAAWQHFATTTTNDWERFASADPKVLSRWLWRWSWHHYRSQRYSQ
jgi:hypothetical protein